MSSRLTALGIALLLAAPLSCQDKATADAEANDDDGEPPAAEAQRSRATLSTDDFCHLVVGAPRRHLRRQCSAKADQQGKGFKYLSSRAATAIQQCRQIFSPGVEAGRLGLLADPAERCAKALEAASFKETLLIRDLTWQLSHHADCQDLLVGKQAQGKPCRLNLECQQDLHCAGAAQDKDGACQPRPGQGQSCSVAWLAGLVAEGRGACGAGLSCTPGGSDLEAIRRRAEARAALRLAADFGMLPLPTATAGGRRTGLDDALGVPLRPELPPPDDGDPLSKRGNLWGEGAPAERRFGSGEGNGESRLDRRRARPPRVRMGATAVSGRLPPEVIQRIVRQNFGRFRLCYENGLGKNPSLEGRVTVRFVIGTDGRISQVSSGGDLPDQGVISCVTRAFHGLTFPKPEGGIVSVSYPLVFSPGDPPSKPGAGGPDAGAPDASSPDAGAEPERATGSICEPARGEQERCEHSYQCQAGLWCRGGKCAKGLAGPGSECQADSDCAAGSYCAGTCQPVKPTGASCTTAAECAGACGSDGKCFALCGAG